jgi:hypothetical protein
MEGQEAALRTLLLAQRTPTRRSPRRAPRPSRSCPPPAARPDTTLTSARSEAESTLSSARAEAERTLASARSEAESTLAASQHKAATVDQEVAARISAATGDLDERRRALESRIEELRVFEREYRTRLQAYLEGQLRDLSSRSGPDDGGVGVPAGNRAAASPARPVRRPGAAGRPLPRPPPRRRLLPLPPRRWPPLLPRLRPRLRPRRGACRRRPASGRAPEQRFLVARRAPLSSSAPAAVGPFTVVPPASGEDASGDGAPTDR